MKPEIVTVPNKFLREPTEKVGSFDVDLKEQVEAMISILRNEDGVGIAANQLGFNNKIFVIEFDDPENKNKIPLQVFINPEIVEKNDEIEAIDEGCLSVPKIELPIERSTKVKIKAQNLEGKKFKITAKGLAARVIQHENDHLHGILFTDLAREKFLKCNPEIRKLKIAFIGTGDFAHYILEGLILLGLNIQTVITEKSKPSGREKTICDTPVGNIAKLFNKILIETDDIKKLDIDNLKADLIVLADFGQIIPESIIKIPKMGIINIHPSLLPKYRGPSPIQTAILNGEKETGISIIKVSLGIDEGLILTQQIIEIWPEDNSQSLKTRLSNLSLKMLIKLIPEIQKGNIKETNQDNTNATITRKFNKTDGEIDWKKSATIINNQIRAFFPWPGAYTFIDNKRLIIHHSHLETSSLNAKRYTLVLDVVQPEGKKPMLWKDFLRGYRGEKPSWLKKVVI